MVESITDKNREDLYYQNYNTSTSTSTSTYRKKTNIPVELLASLIGAERDRAMAMEDPNDRDDALAALIEGDEVVMERIRKGVDAYMCSFKFSSSSPSSVETVSKLSHIFSALPGEILSRLSDPKLVDWDISVDKGGYLGENFCRLGLKFIN